MPGCIVSLRGREVEPAIAELLGLAQIHRAPDDATSRGQKIAAEYASADDLDLYGYVVDEAIRAVVGSERTGATSAVIRDLAVAPEHRRLGIGRALLAHTQERFDALEGDTLEPAVDFYRACGFEVVPDGTMPDGQARYRFTWRR